MELLDIKIEKIISIIFSIEQNKKYEQDFYNYYYAAVLEKQEDFEKTAFTRSPDKLSTYKDYFEILFPIYQKIIKETYYTSGGSKIRVVKLYDNQEQWNKDFPPKEYAITCDMFIYEEWKKSNYVSVLIGIEFLKYLDINIKELTKIEDVNKLKWTGKVSHLGFIFRLLAELGYIDAPKRKNGEINAVIFAEEIRKAFEYEGNNEGTLAKMLQENGNNMKGENQDKFKIPHIKDLDN